MCLQVTPSYIEASHGASSDELQTVLVTASERLAQVVCDKFQKFDSEEMTRCWFGVCEEAVTAIFRLHPAPDVFLGKMVLSAYSSWAAATSSEAPSVVIRARLARFLFLCGQGALSLLLYTEKIANSAKKALEVKDKAKREEEKAEMKRNGTDEGTEVDDMEEEMGLTAMADAEHERVFNTVVEVELVANSDNLLGTFHPFIAYVVANSGNEYSNPLVREAAVLALCRYMSVSSVLCEEYLPLLFTVLERETNEAIRTSIVIATGDLSFRFPNAVEPWTARMYDRLSDECLLVRYNTLMVLTHLILNDMIKVKGQVSAVVMCLNDSSDKVCSLARLFFTELSKRSNNPVYNLLGDVISTLSRDKTAPVEEPSSSSSSSSAPSEEVVMVALVSDSNAREHRELTQVEFHRTMQFLLSFVTKDKQADSLLERLLVRMAAAVSLKQRRNLAYCISQLPVTDKGVKRMTELLRQMKDCLFDKDIVESLKLVVSKAKKTTGKSSGAAGMEVKEAATEFDDFVKSIVEENGENVDGENNMFPDNTTAIPKLQKSSKSTTKKVATQKQKKAPSAKKKATKKVVEESSSDEEESESEEEEEEEEEEEDAISKKGKGSSKSKRGLRC
jgi:condensin complex subunit 1